MPWSEKRMQCDRAMERFLDVLTGEAGGEIDQEAREHIAGCRVCGPEAARLEATWNDLDSLELSGGGLDPEEATARRLNDAFWARARAEIAGSGRVRRAPRRRLASGGWVGAAAALALLLGGAGGYLLGLRGQGSPAAPHPADGGEEFLLLLHESPAVRERFAVLPVDSVVREYRDWARELETRGRLAAAEKLEDEARWVVPAGGGIRVERRRPDASGDAVSGYFVIRASDYEEALQLAEGAPHLKYGGTIEVRGIDQGS